MTRRVALLLFVGCLEACVYGVRPAQPPVDPDLRRQLEDRACWSGAFPVWLDDTAVSRAATLDRQEADASRANDSFRGSTYSSQPPSPSSGQRVAALMEARQTFQQRCAVARSAGKGAGARPAAGDQSDR